MNGQSPLSFPEALEKRRARLLVVDDQPANIMGIRAIFMASHEVFMATSGEEALAFCLRTPPDLVLLDLDMPGVGGLEVCRMLKRQEETRDVPVIFVTAHRNARDESDCWDAGGVDFVTKPINPATLRNRVRAHLTIKFQSDLLRELAFADGLTRVANRRFFDERLEKEWRRSLRSHKPMALILIDVDFFKRYNDFYGHQMGDECLRAVAQALRDGLKRPDDFVARYGGEEFICLLPETNLDGAKVTAAALEASVAALAIAHAASDVRPIVSVSIGVASTQPLPTVSPEALLALADSELYRAKQSGRAQVRAAQL